MPLTKFDGLELPASADFHVHLRDGNMMKAVVPTIRQGGVNTVYVIIALSETYLPRVLMMRYRSCRTWFRLSPQPLMPWRTSNG